MKRGEIHFADLDNDSETIGNDIRKTRPVIILGYSGRPGARYTVLPLTSKVGKVKQYEVAISLKDMTNPIELKPSKVLIYHLRSLDFRQIYDECVGVVSPQKLQEIDNLLACYLALDFKRVIPANQTTIDSLQAQLTTANVATDDYKRKWEAYKEYDEEMQEIHDRQVRRYESAIRAQQSMTVEAEDKAAWYALGGFALGTAYACYKLGFLSSDRLNVGAVVKETVQHSSGCSLM